MNSSPDIRAWLVAACVCLGYRLGHLGATAVVAPVPVHRGWLIAADASAPALRLPVFAHRPMGTQH